MLRNPKPKFDYVWICEHQYHAAAGSYWVTERPGKERPDGAILYVLGCVFYLHVCVGDEVTSDVTLGMFEYSCTRAVMEHERGAH